MKAAKMLCFLTGVHLTAAVDFSVARGYFLHVTDAHLDPLYDTYSGQRGCKARAKKTKLGKFGEYACDSPIELIRSAFRAAAKVAPEPDAIFWTGDTYPHWKDERRTVENTVGTLSTVTDLLAEAFPKSTIVLVPTLGNHDYNIENQHPGTTNPVYQQAAHVWQPWIQVEEEVDRMAKSGYYERRLAPKLVTLNLNTNIYNFKHGGNYSDPEDPGGQFAWLEGRLENARNMSWKVIVTAHIGPGTNEKKYNGHMWQQAEFNDRLVGLFVEYAEVIWFHAYGHSHTDSFFVIRESRRSAPVGLALFAPAITAYKRRNNPSFRRIDYDVPSLKLTDIRQYYLNLTEANRKKEARWQLYYTYSSAYGLDELSVKSIEKLQDTLEDEFELFDAYYAHNSARAHDMACDEKCRIGHLCAMRNVKEVDYRACIKEMSSGGETLAFNAFHVATAVTSLLVFC